MDYMAAQMDRQVDGAISENDRLRLENDELRKDAERYRWLRGGRLLRQGHDTGAGQRKIAHDSLKALMSFAYWCSEEQLDAAIDAEIHSL